MNDIPVLDGPEFGPEPDGPVERLVILCHGYGADGNDLIGLAPAIAQLLPNTKFVAPNAPQRCEQNPMGYQWFGITNMDPEEMARGVRAAAPALDAFIDAQLEKYGLDESRLALVGFSQGTMMSLHVGLRREKQLASIVGYSGALPDPEGLKREIRSKPEVLLIHGDADPVVPVQALVNAVRGLHEAGVTVGHKVCEGVPHSIDQTGMALGAHFLAKGFGLPNQLVVEGADEGAQEGDGEAAS
jgi:phospholipase/carboxylesterase